MAPADRAPAPMDRAQAWIDAEARPLPSETIGLKDAAGRVLSEEIRARSAVPPGDRAAIDGIGVRADETLGASAYNPLPFSLGETRSSLTIGIARLVHAGDVLPNGLDAVLPLDYADVRGDTCEIIEPVAPGAYVERSGSHVSMGEGLLEIGATIKPADLGLLALAGVDRVSVVRRPRVRVALVGKKPDLDGPDANALMLHTLIERDGGSVIDFRAIGRDWAALADTLAAPDADIVLVVGGTGRGGDDRSAEILARHGTLTFWGIALHPGDTTGMGSAQNGALVFLLPGAPVACFWSYEIFAGRALRAKGGRDRSLPYPERRLKLAGKISSALGTTEIHPVRLCGDGAVEPIASFAETGLASIVRADGFVIVPAESEGFSRDSVLTVYLYCPTRTEGVSQKPDIGPRE